MVYVTLKNAGIYRFPIDFHDISPEEQKKFCELVVKAAKGG